MRKNLFLYSAIACFVAIIAILVFSGYLGVFDTLGVTTRGYKTTVTADEFNLRSPEPTIYATLGDRISFAYELENRQYSPYETHVEATLWGESQPGPLVLSSQDEKIEPFQKLMMEWAIDPEVLKSRGFSEGQYTVKIQRDGLVRKSIMIYFSSLPKPPYYIPVPVPP